MVKLGNSLVDKAAVKAVNEDGFDTVPLITPLDPGQLQLPHGDQLVVKTTGFDSEKQRKPRNPKIAEFSISVIDGVYERVKMSLLVICALFFLVCVIFLVVYKAYQLEQPCPDNFIHTQGRCMPTGLYGGPLPAQGPHGRLFTLINHYNLRRESSFNLNRQSLSRSLSPWISIVSEERMSEEREESGRLE